MSIEQWITAGVTLGVVLIGIMRNEFALSTLDRNVNKRMDTMQETMHKRMDTMQDTILRIMDARFEAAHQGLLRVEQVLDARLKHLEER